MKKLGKTGSLAAIFSLILLVFSCQVAPPPEENQPKVQSWDVTQPVATISGTTITLIATNTELMQLVAVGLDQGSALSDVNIIADFDNGIYYIEAVGKDGDENVMTSAMDLIRNGDGLYVPGSNKEVHHCINHCDIKCSFRRDGNNNITGCDCGTSASSGFCNHEKIEYTEE